MRPSTAPGQTALTRTPRARALERGRAHHADDGVLRRDVREDHRGSRRRPTRWRRAPPPPSSMRPMTCRRTRNVPRALTAMILPRRRPRPARGPAPTGPVIPAQCATAPIPPKRSTAASTHARTSAEEVTSPAMGTASPCTAAAVASSPSASRSPSTSGARSAARRTAHARPMSPAAPVTIDRGADAAGHDGEHRTLRRSAHAVKPHAPSRPYPLRVQPHLPEEDPMPHRASRLVAVLTALAGLAPAPRPPQAPRSRSRTERRRSRSIPGRQPL